MIMAVVREGGVRLRLSCEERLLSMYSGLELCGISLQRL